jgi:hypothetical protein
MVRFARGFGFVVAFFLIGGLGIGFLNQADAQAGGSALVVADSYRPGPLASRGRGESVTLPDGAGELLSLSVLIAFLYGFRASGLSRTRRGDVHSPRS